MKPEDLLYAETHEWVSVDEQDGGKVATIGISAFAIEQLSDLVFLELPDPGREVKAGESFAEIESVKSVSDIYSPIDGEVIESHKELSDDLDTMAGDPFGAGWLVKIRISDDSGLSSLMDYETYQKQCADDA